MSASDTLQPPPQTSAITLSALSSPETAAGTSSSEPKPHVVHPTQTAVAVAVAVPVSDRFAALSRAFGRPSSGAGTSPSLSPSSTATGVASHKGYKGAAALRSIIISPASSPLNSSASSTPAKSVPALAAGASLLDRVKPSLASLNSQEADLSVTATPTAAAARASLPSKTGHTRNQWPADADSVKGCPSRDIGGAVAAPSSMAAAPAARQSLLPSAVAASPGKLYRPPHAREDSLKQLLSAGDSGGGGNDRTVASMDADTTDSTATRKLPATAAAVAVAAAMPNPPSSSSPPSLRLSVSAAGSGSIDAPSSAAPPRDTPVVMAVHDCEVARAADSASTATGAHIYATIPTPAIAAAADAKTTTATHASSYLGARRSGGSSASAAPSSAVFSVETAAAVGSGAPPTMPLPPRTINENGAHGGTAVVAAAAAEPPSIRSSSATTAPTESDAAGKRKETEQPSKLSRSAKRKQKMRAAAAAAAAAAEAGVEAAAEHREVAVAQPEGGAVAATRGKTATRTVLPARSSSSRAAPNTSSVSRRPGWYPSLTTPAAASAALPGESAVDVAGGTEAALGGGAAAPQAAKGPSETMSISLAGTPLSTSYAGQISHTMSGISDAAGQLLTTEIEPVNAGATRIRVVSGDGGGHAIYMNGCGYPPQSSLHNPRQYYAVSPLSQQQLQMAAYGHHNSSPIVVPQQQQHSHMRPATAGTDLTGAAAAGSPNSTSTNAKPPLNTGAASASVASASAAMLDPATTTTSTSGGGTAPPPQLAPGLHKGRGAAAAATSQSIAGQLAPSPSPPPPTTLTETGHTSPSTPLLLRSGNLANMRLGVSTTMGASSSAAADHAAACAAASMAATSGTRNFAAPRTDVTSNSSHMSSSLAAMGVGGAFGPMLSMASCMPRNHHNNTPLLVRSSCVSGQYSQRPHQHHHRTTSLGGVSLEGSGGNINTCYHEDIEAQSSMSPGAALEHTPASTSPHTTSPSLGGASVAVNWGSSPNHGRSVNAKQKGAAIHRALSRVNSNLYSGTHHGHPQQQALSMMMRQPGSYMKPIYGDLPNANQQGAGPMGSNGGGTMLLHHSTLNVGGGGAGPQTMSHHHHHHPRQHQQHAMANLPPIPYYDFITVLPTFVEACLTLQPEDEANREQLCWTIEAVLRKHLNQNAEIRVHGSITTGLALPSSDVDLLVVGYQPIAPLEALQRLSKALLELDEDRKNDALRLQELIEAEAQHRRRQVMEEEKERAKQLALASAAATISARVAAAPGEDPHRTRESRSVRRSGAGEHCEAAKMQSADGNCTTAEESDGEGEQASSLSPKRVTRRHSAAKNLLLGATVATEQVPVMDEVNEVTRAAPNRGASDETQRSLSLPKDGAAEAGLRRSCSASSSSMSTEPSTACSSTPAFSLDTRKVFLTAVTDVDDDGEFVHLASGSGSGLGFGSVVAGTGALSARKKSGVGRMGSSSAARRHDPDVSTAEDTEVYGTIGDVEQAEEVFRGQIEKDYSFSTSVDLSSLFAPSMGGVMPPVAPPPAASSSGAGRTSGAGSGLALQTSVTRLHDSASLSSSRVSMTSSGCAERKEGALSLPPETTAGLNIDEDCIAARVQVSPRSTAAAVDAEGSTPEAECQCPQVRPLGGSTAAQGRITATTGRDTAAAEAEAAHAATETVAVNEGTAPRSCLETPAVAISDEKVATVRTAAPAPVPQGAVTRNPGVHDLAGGGGAGHLTYVPVHEGPLFFVQAITATRVPVIKLTDKATGTKVDITFAGGEHWRSMQLTRSLLEVFPHARPLILFLKYCVRSLGAGESEPGGVTSFAIYLMVLHFYNECRKRVLLLLRERSAASSSLEGKAHQAAGAAAVEQQQQDRAAEEAARRGGARDKSAAPPAATRPAAAAARQGASPTTGFVPLNLGLLEHMLSEYLARVEQRHAQMLEEADTRRSASVCPSGAGGVAELYKDGEGNQKSSPAPMRTSFTVAATGACATIKAAYAHDDKERLRSIRQTILGFVGDPAVPTTATVARASQAATGVKTGEEDSAEVTQEQQLVLSDAAEGGCGGGAVAGASSSTTATTTCPLHKQQSTNATGAAHGGGATCALGGGEVQAPAVDTAPGRLAPPPHHYLLKTVEPQPHERVASELSHVDTPSANEVAGSHSERVLGEEILADGAAAETAEGTEKLEGSPTVIASCTDHIDPGKMDRYSARSASLTMETETAGSSTASAAGKGDLANGQDAAGVHASREVEAAQAAAWPSKEASEERSDDGDDSAFDAFAADFLCRQANVSDLFLDFCHYYGCAFDYETCGIRFATDGRSDVVAKPLLCSRRGQHFHMTSPFDPEYDLTARMTHMRDFQWLCWWFAEWGAARQSPQYYGSCSLQYVLQCLSPMSADADCQAVHQALMRQAIAAARKAESAAAAAFARTYADGGTAGEGGRPHHGMDASVLASHESIGNNQHMMLPHQLQSSPRQPRMMMPMGGNAKMHSVQPQQSRGMGGSMLTMSMNAHAHPQQPQRRISMSMSSMHMNSSTRVEQQRRGDAVTAQHYAATPFPHLQSIMMSPGSPAHAYQQQTNLGSASIMDAVTYAGGGGFGGHDHRNASHPKGGSGSSSNATNAAKKGSASHRHQSSDGVSTAAHETSATRAASSRSRSLPASESGATGGVTTSARAPVHRRPSLKLPCVESQEEAFDGSTSHTATTPTTAGAIVVRGGHDEGDDADSGDAVPAAVPSLASENRAFSRPYGESQEGTWTSRTATTPATVYSGSSPLDRVDMIPTSVRGGEEEEDEPGGLDGDRGHSAESAAHHTNRFDQYSGFGGANAFIPQHHQQQTPHDVQAALETAVPFIHRGLDFGGTAGVREQAADGPCDSYAPSMTYSSNYSYAAPQQQSLPYGRAYMANPSAGAYVSPQQLLQQEHSAAAAAFYYHAFALRQQQQQRQYQPAGPIIAASAGHYGRQQQQPIGSTNSSPRANTAGASSSSCPFPALYYDVQQHLWQHQQPQQHYHMAQQSSGFDVALTAAAADQDGGSSHRSDGTSSTTATSGSTPQQQQQRQTFTYTPYVGYPNIVFGVSGAHSADVAWTSGSGGEMPQQQQPAALSMPSMISYRSAAAPAVAAAATGSPLDSSSGETGVCTSEPPRHL
ncbi:hypothetical protein CUR178_07947 [Leishmania enriettii]|uniref:Polymerase nucleotidyl transferase domain-containing protein n=1 Tax=Leishmania enriettii TaxID=5663 RepID=A0A836I168_LEIEN|nr:hypothetical protein CUR178_07947 [Leishmania enriettii]